MVERARIRCPICRSALPVTVLWAVGNVCPRCSQALDYASGRPVATAKARRNPTPVGPRQPRAVAAEKR